MSEETFMGLSMSEARFVSVAESFFKRYDVDGSMSINSSAELNQLANNITFALKLPLYIGDGGAEKIMAIVASAGDMTKDPMDMPSFVEWFKMSFLEGNEGGGLTTSDKKLKVQVITWNVGNAMVDHDMSPMIAKGGDDFDVIAFGGQEAEYDDTIPKGWSGGTKVAEAPKGEKMMSGRKVGSWRHFYGTIQSHLGDKYAPVESVELLEMRLIVFAKTSLIQSITEVETAMEATGILHVVGNKGGLVVRFSCLGSTFAFVSCHLAAHEGEKYRQARNENCYEVLEGARIGIPQLDIVPQTSHVFWMGDLNYRLDPYRFGMLPAPAGGEAALPKSGTPEHKAVWDKFQELIAAEAWDELYKHDEFKVDNPIPTLNPKPNPNPDLKDEINNKRVLCGFEEGPINFPPTFKVRVTCICIPPSSNPDLNPDPNPNPKVLSQKKLLKENPDHDIVAEPLGYTTQRWPAYCDRILWHSHPTRLGDVMQTSYEACLNSMTSDHKPVKSSFEVVIHEAPAFLPLTQPDGAPDIWLSNLVGPTRVRVGFRTLI